MVDWASAGINNQALFQCTCNHQIHPLREVVWSTTYVAKCSFTHAIAHFPRRGLQIPKTFIEQLQYVIGHLLRYTLHSNCSHPHISSPKLL